MSNIEKNRINAAMTPMIALAKLMYVTSPSRQMTIRRLRVNNGTSSSHNVKEFVIWPNRDVKRFWYVSRITWIISSTLVNVEMIQKEKMANNVLRGGGPNTRP